MAQQATQCWCGNANMLNYSPDYALCEACNSLVLKVWPDEQPASEVEGGIRQLERFQETPDDPALRERTRQEMANSIPRWLGAFLKYRLPPASVLELSAVHESFFASLRAGGYQVAELESAHKDFDIGFMQSALESQAIVKGSLDIVSHMNFLERLPDPVGVMRLALDLLKPDGFMLLQTPCYDPEKTFEELVRADHPILVQFDGQDHARHFFSMQALEKLFSELGWNVCFEALMSSGYNMIAMVSRQPLSPTSVEERVASMQSIPSGPLALALLDAYERAENMQYHAEGRLETIQKQGAELKMLRKAAQERLETIQAQGAELEIIRTAAQERLELIQKLDAALKNKSK